MLTYRQRLALKVYAFIPKANTKVWSDKIEPYLVTLNRMEDNFKGNDAERALVHLHSDKVRYYVRKGELTKQEAIVSLRNYIANVPKLTILNIH